MSRMHVAMVFEKKEELAYPSMRDKHKVNILLASTIISRDKVSSAPRVRSGFLRPILSVTKPKYGAQSTSISAHEEWRVARSVPAFFSDPAIRMAAGTYNTDCIVLQQDMRKDAQSRLLSDTTGCAGACTSASAAGS